jgi:hypothetical protein
VENGHLLDLPSEIGQQHVVEVVDELIEIATGASGLLVSARWLLKPPEPLATQI